MFAGRRATVARTHGDAARNDAPSPGVHLHHWIGAARPGRDGAAAACSVRPKQSDRPTPVEGDEPGFQPIFDGKTLTGWEGDPKYWRAENGVLIGEITPATVIKSNTFIIWAADGPRLRLKSTTASRRPGTAASTIAARPFPTR